MINFYILSKRFFVNRKRPSGARVVSMTKTEYGFAVHFIANIHKIFKDNV